MIACPRCGQQNPDGFKFCGNCASPLEPATAAREQRKTVTVLFCDVAGSTAMGENADPEALRTLLARYFERMKAIVEAHGGTVEKFIGDAVMAVFGVPTLHEDDALRAVRAAIEMRDALPELGIQARIGVNTGEVVTGTAERLATGDPVNVAARLQQAAAPQEILIGRDTHVLLESVIDAIPTELLTVKGKAQPVAAYRLAGLTATPARRIEAPMVGRATELRRLRDAYEQAVSDRSCQLFTVLGSAGVGKSRLVYEFLDGIDATVLRGACLSYGDGITYWPVIDVVRQVKSLRPDVALDPNLASLLGEGTFTAESDEIAWAFRELLQATAASRPLVIVFDDLQWAESKFLDLIEHVADLSRDAPLVLLCMARPDLLDRRPTWAGGKLNATNLLLEPLSGAETAEMVGSLVGGLSEQAGRRVVEAAEGNPLFVEEMLALVRESGDESVGVPLTIQALLAARLDQLDDHERAVLERGSVEGRLFHRGAVEALYPEDHEVASRLTALVRKDLVRPDKTDLPGQDAFRFRHLLIRDAAYDALPKSTRADLHERFASWLEEFGSDVPEADEILGYHLEQACGYRLELGQDVDPAVASGARDRLAAAGRRATTRGDHSAAVNLLGRADNLPGAPDVAIQFDYAWAMWYAGQGTRAQEIAQEQLDRAIEIGDRLAELCARIEIEVVGTFMDPAGAVDRLVTATQALADEFEATDSPRIMYILHQARATIAIQRCDFRAGLASVEAAAAAARSLGSANTLVPQRATFRVDADEPNTLTLAWFESEAAGYHANVDSRHAGVLAALGRFDEARALIDDELRWTKAFGQAQRRAVTLGFEAIRIEELAGDLEAAVTAGEEACRLLEESGSVGLLSTTAAILARTLFYAGDLDAAERWADRARELASDDDIYTVMLSKQTRGLTLAKRGEEAESGRLLGEAVALGEATHSPGLLGDAYFDMGTAMALLGRHDEAGSAFAEALALYERKENLVMAERTRHELERLAG